MAIGTPVGIGQLGSASVTSQALTTTVNISIGDMVLVFSAGTGLASGVVDAGGNSYGLYFQNAAYSGSLYVCESATANVTAQASGITVSYAGGAANHAMAAAHITGMQTSGALDKVAFGGNSGSGTTFTSPSMLASVPNTLVYWMVNSSTAAFTSFAAGSGFTLLQSVTSSYGLRVCYAIASNILDVPFSPSWTGSQAWGAKGARIKGASQPYMDKSLLTYGVG